MLDTNACIMIVDDMKIIRKSITLYLKKLGYENIIEAVNGLDAVNKFKANKIDFAFMDIVMPTMDGYQALKAILKHNESARICMLSSIAADSASSKCVEKGAIGFLLKPLNKDDGPQKLQTMLEKA